MLASYGDLNLQKLRVGWELSFDRRLSLVEPPITRLCSCEYHTRCRPTNRGLPPEAAHVGFKIHNRTRLRKVFRAYSTRQGISLAQLAFSLPASPEVLIEGTQTADDIGLEDGGVIDATPPPPAA